MHPTTDRLKRNLPGILVAALLLTLPGVLGCFTMPGESRRLEAGQVVIEYHDIQTDQEISSLKMQHPFSIREDQVEAQLLSLYYESLDLLSKPRQVFHPEQIVDLKRLLAKALTHAKPNTYISFQIPGEDGNTSGDLFANNGQLNWRLDTIEGEGYKVKSWARMEQKWRMVPRQGQSFYTKKILMERELQNWIVANLDLPVPLSSPARPAQPHRPGRSPQKMEVPPAAPAPTPAPTAREQELERKLQILDNLRKKQLIDEDEYNSRRKQLLDAYF